MHRRPQASRPGPLGGPADRATRADAALVLVGAAGANGRKPATRSEAMTRAAEAEDTLRAIGAGEVDAFVVSDGGTGRRVFTLTTADRPYRIFVENMRDGAATLSEGGRILYANRRLAELLSCPREAIVGSMLEDFLTGTAPIGWEQSRGPDGRGATIEADLITASGVVVPVLIGVSPLEIEGDRLSCLTFTDQSVQKAQEREITRLGQAQTERLADLQRAQAALTEQATHDALTNLPNRALVVGLIDQALARSRREGGCTAVLFVDLDRFKQINDTHGHAAGDTVLRWVAGTLVHTLRPADTVARIGGDEFVVLAPDVAHELDAADVAARLITALSTPIAGVGNGEVVGASVGVAASVDGHGTAESLLDEADTAMYLAKSLGGGRAEVFDTALGLEVQQRGAARRVLESAVKEERILVHYQPIVDLATGSVAGFEALARITGRDGSVLAPAEFIPLAEQSGLVVALGAQVLAQACEQAMGWRAPAGPHAPGPWPVVAVNLSARQFDSGDLETVVRDTLDQTGLDPRRLLLELTETVIIDLRPDVLSQLAAVRALGVEIGLDDFGTGYASLTHLRRLPLTFVKIDQSFVQGLCTDPEDDRIVAAVIDLAATLGLRSVAEGVETDEQLEKLRALGCDQVQGFLFARPLAAGDVASALARPAC